MSQLTKNIIHNTVGKIMLILLGFISVKYIFGYLGEDALGIIYFSATINIILTGVLSMGVSAAIIREISDYSKENSNYCHDLIRTGTLFYWSVYILLLIVIYFLVPVLAENWLNLKTTDETTAIRVLRILGIASLAALPQSFYTSLFRGIQRMALNNLIDVFITAIRQVGIILILHFGGSLLHIAYWIAASHGICIFVYIIFATKFFQPKALIPGYFPDIIKKNKDFAFKMTLQTVFLVIYKQFDKLIISRFMPIGVLGYYSFGYNNVAKGSLLTWAIQDAAFPSLSALHKKRNKKAFYKQYQKLLDIVCFGNVLILSLILFSIMPLYSYMLNENVAKMMFIPMIFLCLGFYMNSTLRIPIVVSLAVGKPELTLKTNFYSLFIVLPLTVYLISKFGLTGAALSLICQMLFNYAYVIPKICSECLQVSARVWYWYILKIFFLIGIIYGVALYILNLTSSFTIPILFITYLFTTMIFLISSYFVISEELKNTLLDKFQIVKTKIVEVV